MDHPFLPEPEAVVAIAPKKNSAKTLILWVVLVVMFLAIWQFLTPSPDVAHRAATDAGRHAASADTCTSSFWTSTVVTIALALVLLVLVLFVRAFRQSVVDFQSAQEPGRLAMAQRRFPEAVEKFRATLPQFSKQPAYRAVALLNVAEAQLRAGLLDEAIASCAEIERARNMLFASGIRVRVATMTAFVYGLRGDLPTSERWLSEARARLGKNRDDRLAFAAQLCFAEAVVASRKGDQAAAIAQLDRRWNELRYSLNADSMRTVEVIRAFAEAQAGLRGSNTVAERLIRVEPVTSGEFTFLGVAWPEMRAFLGANYAAP